MAVVSIDTFEEVSQFVWHVVELADVVFIVRYVYLGTGNT
jgi:hypothetical protein